MRNGYDPYNSHTARKAAGDTVEFTVTDPEAVKRIRSAQLAHQTMPEGIDWTDAEHVVMENGK